MINKRKKYKNKILAIIDKKKAKNEKYMQWKNV